MAQDENLAALGKLAEAVSSGNLAVLDEVFAPNVVDHDPAPEQGPGPDGYKRFFSGLRAAFPDLKVTVDRLVQTETEIARPIQNTAEPLPGRPRGCDADRVAASRLQFEHRAPANPAAFRGGAVRRGSPTCP
jgi:hypothetical protein